MLANTEALKRAGYDLENEVAPRAGKLSRREDGQLTGELVEQASTKLWLKMPRPSIERAKEAILYAINKSNEWGITSCQEASANTIYLSAMQDLEKENKVTLSCHAHIVYAPVNFAMEEEESLHELIEKAEQFKSQHVRTNFVKFWLDGAPLPPYYTHCDLENGKPQEDKLCLEWDYFLKGLEHVDSKGFTCKLHVAGDGSARVALDAIEVVRKKNPQGPRHELAHCNKIHEGRYTLQSVQCAKEADNCS